jgi:hypothetical protein
MLVAILEPMSPSSLVIDGFMRVADRLAFPT